MILEKNAFHIYSSALLFLPGDTLLSQLYKQGFEEELPRIICGVSPKWPSHQVLNDSGPNRHNSMITFFTFSLDSTRIVAGFQDGVLQSWDAITGTKLGTSSTRHHGPITCLSFLPDDMTVISGSADHTLRLWDVITLTSIGQVLHGHTGMITCLDFSPDGTLIATGSTDRTLRLWGVVDPQVRLCLEGHTNAIICVSFSPDGTRVVSGSRDGTVSLWNITNAAPIGTALIGHTLPINYLAFSSDGNRIVSGSLIFSNPPDLEFSLWDGNSGKIIDTNLESHTNETRYLTISPFVTRVASGSYKFTLRIWDILRFTHFRHPLEDRFFWRPSKILSSDKSLVAVVTSYDTLELWNVTEATMMGVIGGNIGSIPSTSFSPVHALMAVRARASILQVRDPVWRLPIRHPRYTQYINHILFSPDGNRIITRTHRTLRLYNALTGAPIGGIMEGHNSAIRCVVFSYDGRIIASGSSDTTVRLWSGITGMSIGPPLRGHTLPVQRLCFSLNGVRLVSGSYDGTLRLWNTTTCSRVGTAWEGLTGIIDSLKYLPYTNFVVSISLTGAASILTLWTASTGTCIGTPIQISHICNILPIQDYTRICLSDGSTWRASSQGLVPLPPLTEQERNIFAIESRIRCSGGYIFAHNSSAYIFKLPDYLQVSVWSSRESKIALGLKSGPLMVVDFSNLFPTEKEGLPDQNSLGKKPNLQQLYLSYVQGYTQKSLLTSGGQHPGGS
jgi:WD40 repeat protein